MEVCNFTVNPNFKAINVIPVIIELSLLFIKNIILSVLDHSDVICCANDTANIFSGPSWSNVYDLVECGMALIGAE